MTQRTELEQIQEVLSELRDLLQAEGVYSNYAFLFRRGFELLSWASTEQEAVEALKEHLGGIPNAPGTFHDLVIWRESFEERKQVNERLDFLRERLIALARAL